MTKWLNRVVISAPRNGTTTHTVDPSSAANVVAGAAFTPTAGRLLVAVLYGGVTSTTPTGWTLPAAGFAVANGGLYVWWRSAAGADTITTTHNGSNFVIPMEILEFASGSSFLGATSATGVANGGAGPSLTMAAGTKLVMGAVGWEQGNFAGTAPTSSWSPGITSTDRYEPFSTTDAVHFGTSYQEDSTLTTSSMAATSSMTSPPTAERLMFAVTAVASNTQAPFRRPQIVRQAVNRAGSF